MSEFQILIKYQITNWDTCWFWLIRSRQQLRWQYRFLDIMRMEGMITIKVLFSLFIWIILYPALALDIPLESLTVVGEFHCFHCFHEFRRCSKECRPCSKYIWAAPSEFGTYRLCEQRRFRRACASAQSRQNLRCSLIQSMSQEEPSDRKPDPWLLWMAGHAQLKFVMTECSKTQIRLTGPICSRKEEEIPLMCRLNCTISMFCYSILLFVNSILFHFI